MNFDNQHIAIGYVLNKHVGSRSTAGLALKQRFPAINVNSAEMAAVCSEATLATVLRARAHSYLEYY
jgi:hypothetical protein